MQAIIGAGPSSASTSRSAPQSAARASYGQPRPGALGEAAPRDNGKPPSREPASRDYGQSAPGQGGAEKRLAASCKWDLVNGFVQT